MSEQKSIQLIDEQKMVRGSFEGDIHKNMLAVADKFHKAGCFSGNIQNAEQAFAVIQAGYEMGIQPMEAVNSFYIVKGKITIYGMALAKRLRKHGWKIKIGDHTMEKCHVSISKEDEEYEYTATKEEVVKLGSNAFQKAPKDKLYWHALSRLVRYYVPEVLGSVSYTHEEMEGNDPFKRRSVTAEVVETEEESKQREDAYASIKKKIEGIESYDELVGNKADIVEKMESLNADQQQEILVLLTEKGKNLQPKEEVVEPEIVESKAKKNEK